MTNTGWGYDNAVYEDPRGQEEDYVENDPALKFIQVIHPRTEQVVTPAFLDGTVLPEEHRNDPRMELAKWITSHPYFAEAAVNRMWSYFFGRGIVDPVDDFRVANPPTHPDLLAALARDFREHGYDLKHLIRCIVTSRTYQLTSRPNESNRRDQINYSHTLPRPLEAVVLLDAISQVTGVPEGLGKMPVGTRAVQMRSPGGSSFLEIFERPLRDVVPEPTGKVNLTEALHMLAGTTFNQKLSKEGGRLQQLLKNGASRPGDRRGVLPGGAHALPYGKRAGWTAGNVPATASPRSGSRPGLGARDLAGVFRESLKQEAVMNQNDVENATALWSRRSILHVGSLSFLGLTLSQYLGLQRAMAATGNAPAAKAQSVILLWLNGGPSHVDTWDPKKNSSFKAISTNVPGIQISELLPRMARHMDKMAIIRTMHTLENNHGIAHHYAMTGHRPSPAMKFPALGSIISKELGEQHSVPPYVMVPSTRWFQGLLLRAHAGSSLRPDGHPRPQREGL